MNTVLSHVKEYLKTRCTPEQKAALRRSVSPLASTFFSRDLETLASLFGSDKWGYHWYSQHYQTHFHALRHRRINLLEVGVGGYEDPRAGGASLRMWKRYFPNAHVFGIDIHDKRALQEPRITIFQGSQDDPTFLHQVATHIGRIDIIIDDGSHINRHVIAAFDILFPLLAENGIYVIEDTQTSYWPGNYGGSDDLDCPHTTMNKVKRLIDGMNYKEFRRRDYVSTYFDRNVRAVHCYHNLVFIQKGGNDENATIG